MEPADPLPIKPSLEDSEFKNQGIVLNHHSMLTPSNFNFSVLRNKTQNFQFRGMLWLTNQNLVYKGFFVEKMGATKVSEKLMKPYCDIDQNQPFELAIPLKSISEIFIGHDETFQKRMQRYSKLRITYQGDDGANTYYFYLTRENLIDDELYISKRCNEWKSKILELKDKAEGKAPTVAPSTPAAPASATSAPVKAAPTAQPVAKPVLGTEGLLKKAIQDTDAKITGKVVVKPLEEREKPTFTAISKPIEPIQDEEIEPEFASILDTLVPVSDEEFSAAAADTSISKCPHCGWILGYATNKCPRCRKEI